MNYIRHYNLLIERARTRKLDSYVERHHVLPRCLGGNDSVDNIIELTAEEHFLAHELLVKIYPGVKGLLYALVVMSEKSKFGTNKLYGWIRKLNNEYRTGVRHSEETKRKMSEAHIGKKRDDFTLDWRNSLSESLKGREFSKEHRVNLSKAMTGRKRKPFTDEHRVKLSIAGKKRFLKDNEHA